MRSYVSWCWGLLLQGPPKNASFVCVRRRCMEINSTSLMFSVRRRLVTAPKASSKNIGVPGQPELCHQKPAIPSNPTARSCGFDASALGSLQLIGSRSKRNCGGGGRVVVVSVIVELAVAAAVRSSSKSGFSGSGRRSSISS